MNLYILLVSAREDDIYAHECPFNTILVTGSSNIDVLGRYIAEDTIGDDCLLHYRKYRKDTDVTKRILDGAFENFSGLDFYLLMKRYYLLGGEIRNQEMSELVGTLEVYIKGRMSAYIG